MAASSGQPKALCPPARHLKWGVPRTRHPDQELVALVKAAELASCFLEAQHLRWRLYYRPDAVSAL
jgi:hypothetical protein